MELSELTLQDCIILQECLFAVILRAGEIFEIKNVSDAPYKEQ